MLGELADWQNNDNKKFSREGEILTQQAIKPFTISERRRMRQNSKNKFQLFKVRKLKCMTKKLVL